MQVLKIFTTIDITNVKFTFIKLFNKNSYYANVQEDKYLTIKRYSNVVNRDFHSFPKFFVFHIC